MRVLMLCEQFLPVVGGAEQGAYLLAATLRSQGALVEVLTFRIDPSWPQTEVLPGDVLVHRVANFNLARRFRGAHIIGLGRLAILLRALRIAAAVRKLASRFDVIHAHNLSSPVTAFAVRSARRFRVPTVATAVNIGDWFDLRVLRRSLLGSRSVRWLIDSVDCWTAVSEAVRSDLHASGVADGRIVHIPYGVSVLDEPLPLPSVATHFLHLGRLATTAPRDVLGLIEAFESVARRSGDAALALVGGGDRLESTRKVVAASRVGQQIQVPGFGDGPSWRRWAHCLVHPSFFEGMSNALLEGMAAGLACVAYDIPPNREALDDGKAGVLVPVGDRSALARELTELATVAGAVQAWGRRAHGRARDVYDIRKIARQTMSAYGTLLSTRTKSTLRGHHTVPQPSP